MRTNLLLSVALFFLLGVSAGQAQVIIANSNVKISAISKADLKEIFIGASSNFSDGTRAVPVTLKDGAAHEAFLRSYIGKSEAAFRASWRSIVFAGQGTMPRAFESESALIDYVASAPGAIGYVTAPVSREKVKTLSVK